MPRVIKDGARTRVWFSHADIEALIGERALQVSKAAAGTTVLVRFEDEMAGKPPHYVGQRASVEVVAP